jgi:peroxiredoxin
MQRKYADAGLVVIGVNEDDVMEDADAFLRSFPVSFEIVADVDGALARDFDLIAMPSSYVIDRHGEIAARHLGFKMVKRGEYEAVIRRLLEPTTAANGIDN